MGKIISKKLFSGDSDLAAYRHSINKKILIAELNNQCNNACFFCNIKKSGSISKEFIINQIEQAGRLHYRNIDFTGSEPTLNKNLFGYIKKAKKCGFKNITIFTNGRMLCYRDFCKKLVDAGVNKLIFSIHSHKRSLHDRITQLKGSYIQLLKSIRNMKLGRNMELGGYLAVNKYNFNNVHKTIKFFSNLGISFFIISPILPSLYELINTVNIEKDNILNSSQINKLKKDLAKINIANVALNFIPRCLLSNTKGRWEIKTQKGLSKVTIISESGEKRKIDYIIDNITHRKKECNLCSEDATCEGQLNNIDIENQYFITWCISDLHTCEENKSCITRIFKDANRLVWSTAFFAGDSVEGDDGKQAYYIYKNLLSTYLKRKKVFNILGNHEYIYKKGLPSFNLYKEIVSQKLFFCIKRGNICFILLPLDSPPMDIKTCPPNKIKNNTYLRLLEVLKKNKEYIKVVISHYPIHQIKVDNRHEFLCDLIGKKMMPEIWIHGHNNTGMEDVWKKFTSTRFIDCSGAIHNMQSKFILFKDNSPFVVIKKRNHMLRKFIGKDICLDIGKNIKINMN